MIIIKNKAAIRKMEGAGHLLVEVFDVLCDFIKPGMSTLEVDTKIERMLSERGMISQTKGFMGYNHSSCISINDEVVHGVPKGHRIINSGDLVKVDICASWQDYCADMARSFFIGQAPKVAEKMVKVAQDALDKGIAKAVPGNRVSDISAAIQEVVESEGYGIVRDFAGHGIGKSMHEDPEVLNYGASGKGPILRAGMALAIEPMITQGKHHVYVDVDGWTVKTKDKSLAVHVEDTIVITEHGPKILTRK